MNRRAVTAAVVVFATVACERGALTLLPVYGAATTSQGATPPVDASPPASDAAPAVDRVAPSVRFDAGRLPQFGSGGFTFECTSNAQCSGRRPRCDLRLRRCVECIQAFDCPQPSVCDTITERCALPCQTQSDCSRTAQTRCDPNRHICVGCTANDQCLAPTPFCEPTMGQCVECLTDNQCQPTWRFCSPNRFECAECLSDQNCPPSQFCGNGRCLTR